MIIRIAGPTLKAARALIIQPRGMEHETLRQIYDFDVPPAVPPAERARLLGGKGNNLVMMANELQLPVPPGFTITSQVCTTYLTHDWPAGLDEELRAHMERLGEQVGRRFGDQADPLLVSVRSGAPVSMPGMMDTVLNLGLNDATVKGLATTANDPEFAADCLRRFRQSYRDVIGDSEVPEDPWLQLRSAIEAVFRSWNSDRAIAYRRHEGIPDDLGTAVTIQAMVFGNRGPDSGTGVLFTRNPSTGERSLYGDIMFQAQGEDVVAGGHAPLPVSDLGRRLPDVSAQLKEYADLLERHQADLCDIEFTVEQGRLWLLQVRVGKRSPRAAMRMAIEMAEDESFPLSREEAVRRVAAQLADPPRMFVRSDNGPTPIATGLPASPGVATGAIATSSAAAETMAAAGQSVILVRSETSPEDVAGMAKSAGVLTARGGLASHAAVVARGWGIPAVVGASSVQLLADGVAIDGCTLKGGDELTIDGSTGEIYVGRLGGRTEIVPEAATLLGWASELGIEIGTDQAASGGGGKGASPERPAGSVASELNVDDVLRALQIKGLVTPDQLTESLAASPDRVQALVERLTEDGLVEEVSSGFRLSAEGKLKAADLFRADRSSIGAERSAQLLEEFHSLDRRMKDIVTAWQVRDLAGEQLLNDHSDADYDAQVLDDLASLHSETVEWLAPLAGAMKRFETYRSRLARASDLARAGDQRFVASPRVDSYHSVWFELHEDLIKLAGRKRSDEAAAGRA